jgi:trigger factor
MTNSANATVSATISKEEINKNLDVIAKDAAKNMDVQGFRKGKVPVAVVKQRYGEKLLEDAQNEAIRKTFDSSLKELGIDPADLIGEPSFDKFEKNEDGSIELTMHIGVKPSVELCDYKAILPDIKSKRVTAAEIDEEIQTMAASNAPLVKVEEDRAVESGDHAKIDFEGFVDGVAFDGGKAEGYTLEIGSNSFIDNFEDQLVGMKVGDEKDINVTFPEGYQSKDSAGKPALFKVKLHEIQAKGDAEIDDELAKKLMPQDQEATLDKLKEQTKEQIKSKKMSEQYQELKPKYLEKLVESITFDVPNSIIEQEISALVNEQARTFDEEKLKSLQGDEKAIEELKDSVKEDAVKNVKATFIIDELAKAEEVVVNDQEVMQTIYYEAMMTGQDPKQTLEYYEKNGYLSAIKMSMIEQKVITKLFDDKVSSKDKAKEEK